MARTSTPQVDIEAARRATEAKMTAIEKCAQSRAAVVAAEQEDAANYQAAIRAGWTPQELKQFGLTEPQRQAPGRPRKPAKQAGGGNALVEAQLRREAESSVALDRDQTHVVGQPHDQVA